MVYIVKVNNNEQAYSNFKLRVNLFWQRMYDNMEIKLSAMLSLLQVSFFLIRTPFLYLSLYNSLSEMRQVGAFLRILSFLHQEN